MALRRNLSKRLFNDLRHKSPSIFLEQSPVVSRSPQTIIPPYAAKYNFREYVNSPYSADKTFFRRFLQRRAIYQSPAKLPEFLSLPVGEKLRETLRVSNIFADRLKLDGLSPPVPKKVTGDSLNGISVNDARKILRFSQMEKVKTKLRDIPKSSISYSDFVRVCGEGCENDYEGVEFAKMLDDSGTVIVLGNVVFLHPEQVAKSMEAILSQSLATPNDPRKKELEEMEKQKAKIDDKARALVRGELYCGLGFIVAQTLGFMRLTFWELSWDVMEPICFFVTSLHFALGYGFFLRTSTEPSFEGYFQRRFQVKQKKLMDVHKFDVNKYNELCKACYPSYSNEVGSVFGTTCL